MYNNRINIEEQQVINDCSCYQIYNNNNNNEVLQTKRVLTKSKHNCSGVWLLILSILCQMLSVVSSMSSPGADWTNSVPSFPMSGIEETTRRGHHHQNDNMLNAYISYRDETHGLTRNKSRVGMFGVGAANPASGYVYHVVAMSDSSDHSGCELPLYSTYPGGLPPAEEPWIALIARGKCNFEVKVENAYRSNAVGVVVYDDRDSEHVDRMKLSDATDRNISAVFTYKWKGEEIAQLVDNGSRVLLNISPVTTGLHKQFPNINRTSVLFVSISFIVLMVISLTWLVFYYVQRFRYIHAKDRLSRRLCNAAKKALSKIPTKNIKADDKEIEGDGECCAICIEPYKVSDVIRILPCRHEFHKYCIDPWLLEHRTCPMCKMDILKHYGFVFTGSQESILQVDMEEQISPEPPDTPPPRGGSGISPLPQIRGSLERQLSRASSESGSNRSSRATTPDELTPSLGENGNSHNQRNYTSRRLNNTVIVPRQDLCSSCMAVVVSHQNASSQKSDVALALCPSDTDTPASSSEDNHYVQVLTSPSHSESTTTNEDNKSSMSLP